MSKLPYAADPWSPGFRRPLPFRLVVATVVWRIGLAMARSTRGAVFAARARHRRRLSADPVLEFYADASAPEGALFVDGEFIGVLPGVTRL